MKKSIKLTSLKLNQQNLKNLSAEAMATVVAGGCWSSCKVC